MGDLPADYPRPDRRRLSVVQPSRSLRHRDDAGLAWRFNRFLYESATIHRPRLVCRAIAVQIINMRSNENSDLSSVAPDATVANARKDLRRIRIEHDSGQR